MTKTEWETINEKYHIAKLFDGCSHDCGDCPHDCGDCPLEPACLYYYTGDESLFEKEVDN